MPKVGMETIRRQELIDAAIGAIHARGSLDVTIREIAARAGVSQGLAHHYFGSKDRLIVSAMRHLLAQYSAQVRRRLRSARSPRGRVSAVIRASLGDDQFQPEVVSAWLAFYIHARISADARKLLWLYTRRLRSNLVHALKPLAEGREAEIAEGIGALIDGIYIRQALVRDAGRLRDGARLVEDYVDRQLGPMRSGKASESGGPAAG
jgi:TetR/AcrR family transcriptional repressor of bet genes